MSPFLPKARGPGGGPRVTLAAWALLALLPACAANLADLRVQHYGLEAKITEARTRGGEDCAPAALAKATAAWEFAGIEFRQGDVARAQEHLKDGENYVVVANAALKDCRPLAAEAQGPMPGEGAGSSADNDGDGLVDDADKCPSKAEDRDGFQDGDGCPDPDNDGDGFLDANDPCRDKAEDLDGFEDSDGCPDEDNDKDMIPDARDHCVDAAETYNEYADGDGCPDLAPKFIQIRGNKLVQLSPVGFQGRSTELFGESYRVLNEVAAYMQDYTGVRLQIEGHCDNTGGVPENQKLSEQMAQAVKDYLVEQGVEVTRMETAGKGGTMPIDTNRTPQGRAKNTRVEFFIVN